MIMLAPRQDANFFPHSRYCVATSALKRVVKRPVHFYRCWMRGEYIRISYEVPLFLYALLCRNLCYEACR